MAAMHFVSFDAARIKFVDSKMLVYGMVNPKSNTQVD